ncbi:MAG: O-methyltransferase [Bacteroidetes bacterium]|uniref:O-methyltransferase n=1 Tax=Candidatus Cryptobacteroides intestinigallinarum TaxID=2840767 RepID=A0A9D9HMG9_9BACT|nr:O-methyltransferase [Candidatus Cryptobacteroides intestinigallinarum]
MDALAKYITEHSSDQTEALAWIQRQTNIRTNHARMLSGAVQGRFLTMLTEMIRPHDILEIGTFTGYSAVCLASGLEAGGHLDTLEINDELEDLILEGFEKAGLADRITLHIGDAKETLDRLKDRCYDLVFIDANKREYCDYYRAVFDMVRPGGYILADNVLWDGKVCQDPMPQDRQTQGIAAFNDMVKADQRVESVILPVRDGLNIIRKKS